MDTEAPICSGTRTTFGCRFPAKVIAASQVTAGPETIPTVKPVPGGGAGARRLRGRTQWRTVR